LQLVYNFYFSAALLEVMIICAANVNVLQGLANKLLVDVNKFGAMKDEVFVCELYSLPHHRCVTPLYFHLFFRPPAAGELAFNRHFLN
jgi:hypothetical protein